MDVTPRDAQQLREAYKQIGGKDQLAVNCFGDHVEIRSPLTGNHRDPVQLVIMRGGEKGEVLASVMVTPGVFKRLKREMGFFKGVKTGSQLAFRHGNRP